MLIYIRKNYCVLCTLLYNKLAIKVNELNIYSLMAVLQWPRPPSIMGENEIKDKVYAENS